MIQRPKGLRLQGSCRTCDCWVRRADILGSGLCFGAPPQMFPAQGAAGSVGFINQQPTTPAEHVCGMWRRAGNNGMDPGLVAPPASDQQGQG